MRLLVKLIAIIISIAIIVATSAYIYYGYNLPDIEEYIDSQSNKAVQINYSNGNQITRYNDGGGAAIPQFHELPTHLINAVIAIEDQRFFSHYGFDINGIKRAFKVNHKSGKIVQGGSTITQQLTKMLFLSPEKNMKRKIKELILAFRIERILTKEQIITLYLNNAYFGAGNYGVMAAAKHYFNKEISKINLKESTKLAALLKAPSKLSNINNKELADQRAKLVLDRMVNSGFINANNHQESIASTVNYKKHKLQKLYFTDYIHKNYINKLKSKTRYSKLIINSTLDERMQNILEKEMGSFLNNNKDLSGAKLATVIIDKSGAIEAMVGGLNYQENKFNNAVYLNQKIGDLLSILIYASAFESGFTPFDLLRSESKGLQTIIQNYQYGNENLCRQLVHEVGKEKY